MKCICMCYQQADEVIINRRSLRIVSDTDQQWHEKYGQLDKSVREKYLEQKKLPHREFLELIHAYDNRHVNYDDLAKEFNTCYAVTTKTECDNKLHELVQDMAEYKYKEEAKTFTALYKNKDKDKTFTMLSHTKCKRIMLRIEMLYLPKKASEMEKGRCDTPPSCHTPPPALLYRPPTRDITPQQFNNLIVLYKL